MQDAWCREVCRCHVIGWSNWFNNWNRKRSGWKRRRLCIWWLKCLCNTHLPGLDNKTYSNINYFVNMFDGIQTKTWNLSKILSSLCWGCVLRCNYEFAWLSCDTGTTLTTHATWQFNHEWIWKGRPFFLNTEVEMKYLFCLICLWIPHMFFLVKDI